jgi:hypothetical protein
MLYRANSAILFTSMGSGSEETEFLPQAPITKFPEMTICDDLANERATK